MKNKVFQEHVEKFNQTMSRHGVKYEEYFASPRSTKKHFEEDREYFETNHPFGNFVHSDGGTHMVWFPFGVERCTVCLKRFKNSNEVYFELGSHWDGFEQIDPDENGNIDYEKVVRRILQRRRATTEQLLKLRKSGVLSSTTVCRRTR